MSAREHKKPGRLYRVFFKDPDKYRQDDEPEWQMDPVEEWLQAEIHIPQPYIPPERPFGAAPTLKRWVKLTIASEDINADIELTMFPIDIGSVQSSIQLNDKNISPRHAVMDLHNGVLTITDAHSQNGVSIGTTWLNPGVPYVVNAGDTILVGRTRITVLDYAGRSMGGSLPNQLDILAGVPPHIDLASQEVVMEAMSAATDMPVLEPVLEKKPEYVPFSIAEFESMPILEPGPMIEPEPIPEPKATPEPEHILEPEHISEPELLSEPINKGAILKKLMEEPTTTLFRDVLGMKEPEPKPEEEEEEEEPPPEVNPEDEALASEDEALTSEDEQPQDEDLPPPEPMPPSSEICIEETASDSDSKIDSAKEPAPTDETTQADSSPISTAEQTIEEYMESLLSSSQGPAGGVITPADISQSMEKEEQAPAGKTPSEDTAPESEAPEDLSPEDFIEALMQKSSHRPLPKWRANEPEPPSSNSAESINQEIIHKNETPPTASKTCPKCSTVNSDKDKFCGACGTGLDISPPTPAVKAFCGQCGAKNVHSIKFCGECGHKLM